MSTLEQATRKIDTDKLEPIDFGAGYGNLGPADIASERSMFLRAPLPKIDATPDSLRQFNGSSQVPQFRTLPPPPQVTVGVKGDTGATGGAGKTVSITQKSTNSRVDIPLTVTFSGSAQATGTVALGRTFNLMKVLVPAACRIRLYSTTAARDADVSRDVSLLTFATLPNGLLFDLNLDSSFTFPKTWICTQQPEGSDLNAASIGNIAYTVDTYHSVVVSSWSNMKLSGALLGSDLLDPTNPFGDRYDVYTAPPAGSYVRDTASTFYPTQSYFLDSGGAFISYIANTEATGTSGPPVLVPVGAAFIRQYAQTGHFTDSSAHIDLAVGVTTPSITLTFTVLQEED